MEVTLVFEPTGEQLTLNVISISSDDLGNSFNWRLADNSNHITYVKDYVLGESVIDDYVLYDYWKDRMTYVERVVCA